MPDLPSTAPHSYSTVKAIVQGRPGVSGEPVVSLVCFPPTHARLRVQWEAGLPCALISLGGIVSQNTRTHRAARSRKRDLNWPVWQGQCATTRANFSPCRHFPLRRKRFMVPSTLPSAKVNNLFISKAWHVP
jgi:hypothetical protein